MEDFVESDSDSQLQFPEFSPDSGCDVLSCEERGKKRRRRPKGFEFHTKTFEDVYDLCGDCLGKGADSSVQTCRERLTGREYAVKIVCPDTPDHRRRLLREIEILHVCRKQLYILDLKEYFETPDCFYLVFQKMEGGPLLQHICKRGHFSEAEAREVVREIATGLNFLHRQGIAHRDLKPANILCERKDHVTPIRICDFDLGSNLESYGSPVTTPELLTPVGSCEFMAPEVVAAFGDDQLTYDKKCDMWSLGVILYIMLCGRPPFYGNCGLDCDWDNGGTCQFCHEMLLESIRRGSYSLEGKEFELVSQEAKDLIAHLLVCDARYRYTAEEVLSDPWILEEQASRTPLPTPTVLHRSMSSQTPSILENFTATAMSAQRLITMDTGMTGRPLRPCISETVSFHCPSPPVLSSSYPSDDECFFLSPPGTSELARRRFLTSHSTPPKAFL